MKITLRTGEPLRAREPFVALWLSEQDVQRKSLAPPHAAVDRALGGALRSLLASGDFRGRASDAATLYGARGKGRPGRVAVMGLGPVEKLDADGLRTAAGRSARRASQLRVERLTVLCGAQRGLAAETAGQAIAEGLVLAGYRYRKAHEPAKGSEVRSAAVALPGWRDARKARAGLTRGLVIAESQNLARRLSDESPSEMTPAAVAREARAMARQTGLECKVMTDAELRRRRMGGLLAVGGGSTNPPRLVVLTHDPGRRDVPTICVVGKGITFDSGGLSIKPAQNMHEMKHDMSGAADTVGILRAAALLELPLRVVGVLACAENLPSGTAYRPGDIVTTYSGKTIEVLNTDAEGRIVLADALHYAVRELEPDAMVDLATLTGACQIALGGWATGVMGSDDDLIQELVDAGQRAGERAWPLPLLDGHKEAVKSPVADLRNTGGRTAGASTAAAFLSAFTGEVPWAHLDLAGTGWTDRNTALQRIGATGTGVRLVTEFLRRRAGIE